ncbi:ClpP/crotonase-like domain-containing protein [Sporodiniella umbellata]|nr:ClpP/crotonase-like domain-containing protein [Sporodiniella umbellata]
MNRLIQFRYRGLQRLNSTIKPGTYISSRYTHILHKKRSGARMFVLNRPEKLNALNLSMIRNISPQLKAWDFSALAKVILMKGSGEGKFSVGDDILVDVLNRAKAKDPDTLHFFEEKFSLVQMIATLQTPYITILDGYALGGALGLFVHGPFRIATEKTIFALPETSLGAFLNSGSSFYLSRMDGEVGTYLALTGNRLEGIDTFFSGIATHYIPSVRIPALEEKLIDLESSEHEIIQRVLEKFVEHKEVTHIGIPRNVRQMIDRCFAFDTLEEIVDALEKEKPNTWTRETKKKLLSVSPTSLKVTLKALRKAQKLSLVDCLNMEFDLIQKFLVTRDFHEGVQAAFLNKPRRKPVWSPPNIKDILEEDIEQLYFSQHAPNHLTLPIKKDLKHYPYSRYSLPTEEELRLAITGEGPEFKLEGRLKAEEDIVSWFVNGHKGKWGVKEKVLDILARKTVMTEDGIQWDDSFQHPQKATP